MNLPSGREPSSSSHRSWYHTALYRPGKLQNNQLMLWWHEYSQTLILFDFLTCHDCPNQLAERYLISVKRIKSILKQINWRIDGRESEKRHLTGVEPLFHIKYGRHRPNSVMQTWTTHFKSAIRKISTGRQLFSRMLSRVRGVVQWCQWGLSPVDSISQRRRQRYTALSDIAMGEKGNGIEILYNYTFMVSNLRVRSLTTVRLSEWTLRHSKVTPF